MTKKLLIVDDEPEILDLMRMFFAGDDYEVLVASNGSQALDLISRERPQVMVLDAWMPEMDGLQVLKKAREIDGALQIIMVSGEITPDFIRKTLDLGASEFLRKGSSFRDLKATVANRLLAMNC